MRAPGNGGRGCWSLRHAPRAVRLSIGSAVLYYAPVRQPSFVRCREGFAARDRAKLFPPFRHRFGLCLRLFLSLSISLPLYLSLLRWRAEATRRCQGGRFRSSSARLWCLPYAFTYRATQLKSGARRVNFSSGPTGTDHGVGKASLAS